MYELFLDRDGVLNRVLVRGKPYPPASVDEIEYYLAWLGIAAV